MEIRYIASLTYIEDVSGVVRINLLPRHTQSILFMIINGEFLQ